MGSKDDVTRNSRTTVGGGPGHNGGPPLDAATLPRLRGRPSKGTPELRERILEQLAEGKSIRRICRMLEMPSSETIRCWRRSDAEFARQLDLAQEFGWQLLAEDLFAKVEEAINTGSVARARLIFATCRWRLARQAPGFFGGGGWR
jgi:transposase-like protein